MPHDETTANCDFPADAAYGCYNPAHRCCDCGVHTLATYNAAGEKIDHPCASPSSLH